MFRIYMTTQPPELQPLSFASVQGLVSSWVVWNGSRAPATWLRNSSAHCSLVHLLILSKCAFRRVTSCFKLSWSAPVGIFQPKVKLALDMQNCGLWKSENPDENENMKMRSVNKRLMEWTGMLTQWYSYKCMEYQKFKLIFGVFTLRSPPLVFLPSQRCFGSGQTWWNNTKIIFQYSSKSRVWSLETPLPPPKH